MPRSSVNDIRLIDPVTDLLGHFSLYEFQNINHIACIHKLQLERLEKLRAAISKDQGVECPIIPTSGIRTEEDNRALAVKFGWSDEDGRVSRNSKHLLRYGGIATDILVTRKGVKSYLPGAYVAQMARPIFAFIKYYDDDSVHVDSRDVLEGVG